MISPTIDADRLWQTILDMAEIGATPDGGSCRLALSPEDAAARALLLTWCELIGLKFEQDAIGNMFLSDEVSRRFKNGFKKRSTTYVCSKRGDV
jgi:hypothetical protein